MSDEDIYADMPPLIEMDDDTKDVYALADQFVETLRLGDTFRTSANYHLIYLGKREDDMYSFQIVSQTNGQTYDTYYSKLGAYVSMRMHQKM
jgi:hypothetical protein